MIYLLALIGAVAVGYLVWKAFGPQSIDAAPSRRGPIGPDDDTDFLLDLGKKDGRGPRPRSTPPVVDPPVDPTPGPAPRDVHPTRDPGAGSGGDSPTDRD